MVIKLIGSMIVFGASSFLGFALSRDCSKRPHELRILQGELQVFENEIAFLSNLLGDAFKKVCSSDTSTVSIFFRETEEKLRAGRGLNASEAWELSVRENIHKTSLNKEDEEILVSFGKLLGNSDVEGQIKNIRLTLSQLKIQEQKAEVHKAKNEKMYKTLGVLGGLAVVIVTM